MGKLIGRFIDICLLRAGPQDLPASGMLLVLTLLAYIVSGMIVLLPSTSFGSAVVQALVDAVLLAGLLRLTLRWRGFSSRFGQTLTALAGAGAFQGMIAWPLVASVHHANAQGLVAPFQSLLLLALFMWTLLVIGHILRHALSTSYAAGFLFGAVYVTLSMGLLSWFFPQGG